MGNISIFMSTTLCCTHQKPLLKNNSTHSSLRCYHRLLPNGAWSLRLRPSPLTAQSPPTNTSCMMSSETNHFLFFFLNEPFICDQWLTSHHLCVFILNWNREYHLQTENAMGTTRVMDKCYPLRNRQWSFFSSMHPPEPKHLRLEAGDSGSNRPCFTSVVP